MEPTNQRGQVLIECALALLVIASILYMILDFHKPHVEAGLRAYQLEDIGKYKNSR